MSAICPHESERDLIRRAKHGERTALERLLERYRPLVEARARSYASRGIDREDFVQEGLISILTAVTRYDENRSVAFAAFAELCVRRRFITLAMRDRRQQAIPLRVGTSDPAYDGSPSTDLTRHIEDIPLTYLERQVMSAFHQGLTYAEISSRLNCGVKRVDNAMQRIRRKCQRSGN